MPPRHSRVASGVTAWHLIPVKPGESTPSTMPAKLSLTAKNLAALGADRLAELLIEVTAGDAAAQRRLRLAVAETAGPDQVAQAVRKRLAVIKKSRSFVDWRKLGPLVSDLANQRRAIVDVVGKIDPETAVDLLWRFMDLATSLFERCDDSNGELIAVFHEAVEPIGSLAAAAQMAPGTLTDRVFDALVANPFGQFDGLIESAGTALGREGLERVRDRMLDLERQPLPKPPPGERRMVGYGPHGPIYADELEATGRAMMVRQSLIEIADALGDVDAFIDQFDEKARRRPAIAADIAQRLLAAGRSAEALQALDAVDREEVFGAAGLDWVDTADLARVRTADLEWVDMRIAVLESLDRAEEAQADRWSAFRHALSARHLRDYLRRLPDFDDIDAEQQALDWVAARPDRLRALGFLIEWPDLGRAAHLVGAHADTLDGNAYYVLSPAADALAAQYPLAATTLLRAMIDFTLARGRSSRYGHAARHLADCAGLASAIEDYGPLPTHDAYLENLRAAHGRKRSFWTLVD